MSTNIKIKPGELLYKEVIDQTGLPIGKITNLTQNGSGYFDVFGIEMDETAAYKINNGRPPPVNKLFLDISIIERIGKVVRLKKAIEEL